MHTVDLSAYVRVNKSTRELLRASLWHFLGLPLLRARICPLSTIKVAVLRIFGARVGRAVIIRPGVRVKAPWLLEIGDWSWIGEDCWIDNIAPVRIGRHACLSQGVFLCTGNHDWADPHFALRAEPITIEEGAWIAARATVGPGVMVGTHAVATAGSVLTRNIPAFEIHGGNPATFQRLRRIRRGEPDTSENGCARAIDATGGSIMHLQQSLVNRNETLGSDTERQTGTIGQRP